MLPVAIAIVVAFSTVLILLRFSLTTNKANLNVNGKYVLITGCDSGFGRETAIKLDKMGVRVLATCLTKEGEQSLKSVTSDKLKTFQMNVTDSQQIEEVFCKVNKLLGGKSGKTCFILLVVNFLSIAAAKISVLYVTVFILCMLMQDASMICPLITNETCFFMKGVHIRQTVHCATSQGSFNHDQTKYVQNGGCQDAERKRVTKRTKIGAIMKPDL